MYVSTKANLNLAFDPDTYAKQISGATLITAEALSLALENLSNDITFSHLESTDLNTDIQGDYLNPNYQYNTVGVKKFALYLASLPEFQLY